MLLLALDTATDKGSLALLEGEQLLGELPLEAPGSFLVHLLPTLDVLLAQTGRRLQEVEAICVSQGPGNFTGLRLGLATAQGLALALGCPLVPVPTLEALAAPLTRLPHPVAVLVDAKRREVYLGLFDCRGEFPEPLGEPQRLAAKDLPQRLLPPLSVTGPGVTPYEDFLMESLPLSVTLAPQNIRYSRASTLGRLGRRRLALGLTVAPPQLTPLYLRPAL